MTIIVNRIMHLTSGLFSTGLGLLLLVGYVVAAWSIYILVVVTGLILYGIPAYAWGMLALLRDEVVTYPRWWIRAGLAVFGAGVFLIWVS